MTRLCFNRTTISGCRTPVPDDASNCPACGRAIDRQQLLLDERVPLQGYWIRDLLGMGQSGAVYLAQDNRQEDGDLVVLKETALTDGIVGGYDQFRQLQQLGDANLPLLLDMFELDGYGFVVMEYIAAPQLDEILQQRGRLLEKVARGYTLQLLSLLERLHAAEPPFVHGDIKPANLRLTDSGLVKLVDLELFRSPDAQPAITLRDGRYQAPEYRLSGRLRPQADLYSVAATLYHLITAIEPPRAIERVSEETLVAPNLIVQSLSAPMTAAMVRGLMPAPDDRWASAAEFRNAMIGARKAIAALPPTSVVPTPAPPTPLPEVAPPVVRRARGRRWWIAALIGVAVLLIGWRLLAEPAAAVPPDGQLIIGDDFSGQGALGSDDFVVRNGRLQVELPPADIFDIRMLRISEQLPAALTVLVTVSYPADGANVYGGFHLRPADAGAEPVMFMVSRRGNYVITDVRSPAGVATDAHPALTGRTDRLRLEVRAGSLRFFANDRLLTTVEDENFTLAAVSLSVMSVDHQQGGALSFDDLAVYAHNASSHRGGVESAGDVGKRVIGAPPQRQSAARLRRARTPAVTGTSRPSAARRCWARSGGGTRLRRGPPGGRSDSLPDCTV